MGLKRRLVVAFLILLVVPVILITGTAAAILGLREPAEHGSYMSEEGERIYYVKSDEEKPTAQILMPVVQATAFLVITIVLSAVVLVIWLYRSIIKPLSVLRMATNNMKEGNLNFTISGDSDDELGQLCEDFEEMRIRLKEQIDARLKYEQDTVELISNISHDLKTPLTAIKGYTEGILDGVADTENKREKYLRTIYTKASDMTVLVDELAFYSKIDSNIVPYNFEKLYVDDYFNDCVDEQSLDMEVKNVRLSYKSAVAPGQAVLADSEQLRRVMNNLIGNAAKYMDKAEGRVEIRAFTVGKFVRIEIEDNGSGIEAEDLKHIFERFYRADSSRGTRKGGTGLGLAICRKIIEDHGGTITARSVPGEGSTFVFTLPVFTETVVYDEVEDAEYSRVSKPAAHTRRGFGIPHKEDKRNGDKNGKENTDN